MHKTPCLCKRGIWIISIQESSEEQKNKTYSLDHRNLPQKKEGSNAVMKAKKKCCWIYIMGRNLHHRYHKAADAAVQKAQVSPELHSSWWWYPAAPIEQEKIYLPQNSYIKRTGMRLMLWKLLVWYITHPARLGLGNRLPPHPSLQTPRQIVQQYESEPHSYSTLPVKTSPENGQLRRASLQQRLVSVSLFGCQLLSAHAQALFCLPKNWANLFSISTDQGKKII